MMVALGFAFTGCEQAAETPAVEVEVEAGAVEVEAVEVEAVEVEAVEVMEDMEAVDAE